MEKALNHLVSQDVFYM